MTTIENQAAPSGYGGAIQASSQIQQAIGWFRQYLGDGVVAEARWDRTGRQAFPLLAKGDWSAIAIFGAYGHLSLSAIGAKSLPAQSLGLGYNVSGPDISIDLDSVVMKGLAAKLSVSKDASNAASAPGPSQFGLFTLWTVFSVIRDVISILNPTCDLILGGNVTATASLLGESIVVEFQECPAVKLVAMFTFDLTVKRLTVTDKNVHVEFEGSRWVKSRDFAVQ